jgi:hypothetical protein
MFPAQAVENPLNAQLAADAPAAALRAFIAHPPIGLDAHATEWRELLQTDTVVLFGSPNYPSADGGPTQEYVKFHRDGSDWTWSGQGYCVPYTTQPGKNPAEWLLTSPVRPTAQTTVLQVRVTEITCASGSSAADRTAPPLIDYTADAVTVIFLSDQLPTGAFYTCPSNPFFDRTVTLAQPLGHRQLLDGNTDPPHPACLASPAQTSVTGQDQPACQLPY